MADWGIKITNGADVHTATDVDLVYSSKWKSLKIFKTGSGTADGGGTATIAHGLDFIPAFAVYDTNNYRPGIGSYTLNHTSHINITNLTIETGASKNYAYVIFANPLTGTGTMKPSSRDFGIKFTDGANVEGASFDEIGLLSGTGTMQIWRKIELSFGNDVDDTWQETTVNHSLGFVPAYMGWVEMGDSGATNYQVVGNNITIYPYISIGGGGGGIKEVQVTVSADIDNFYVNSYTHADPLGLPAGASGTLYVFCYAKLI